MFDEFEHRLADITGAALASVIFDADLIVDPM
jgi:hypothetical protein